MIMAVLVTGTPSIIIYLPALLICSIITGIFTGLCAQLLVKRGKKIWKTISN
jgi:heptaprenyl diphosphate synthase